MKTVFYTVREERNDIQDPCRRSIYTRVYSTQCEAEFWSKMTTDLNGSTFLAIALLAFVSLRFVRLISSDTRDASLMDDLLPATMQASRTRSIVGREREPGEARSRQTNGRSANSLRELRDPFLEACSGARSQSQHYHIDPFHTPWRPCAQKSCTVSNEPKNRPSPPPLSPKTVANPPPLPHPVICFSFRKSKKPGELRHSHS